MKRVRARQITSAATLAALTLAAAAAAHAQPIDLAIGGVKAHATAVSDTTFRLSVNAAGEVAPQDSVFVTPDRNTVPICQLSTTGSIRSLRTAVGELRVDLAAGTYALLDAKGSTIAPAAPLRTALVAMGSRF